MELPEASVGFHYRMQKAMLTVDGRSSKLARYIKDENTMNRKEKYIDMYCVLSDVNGMPSSLLRCFCGKDIQCAFYSSGRSLRPRPRPGCTILLTTVFRCTPKKLEELMTFLGLSSSRRLKVRELAQE